MVSFARYWTQAGHHVTVLTTAKHPSMDGALIEKGPELDPELFKLIEIPYTAFSEGDRGSSSASSAGSRSKIRALAPTLLDRRARWFLATARQPHDFIQEIDVIVGSHPVVYALFLAAFLGRKYKKPYILDYRDLWTADPRSYKSILPIRIIEKYAERRLIARAAATVTVSDGQAQMMSQEFSCDSEVVENGFESDVLIPGQLRRRDRTESNPRFKIGYFGRFVIPNRDPLPLFESLARLKKMQNEVKLEIVFFGDSHPDAVAYTGRFGLEGIVKSYPAVSSKQAILEQADCDALLFIDWNDPALKGVMTGKIYEYAALGVPILQIGGYPGSDASEFILKHKLGKCFYNDVDSLTGFLANLTHDTAIADQSVGATFEKYSRENLALHYLTILERAASGQST
ncbi:MAG: glycosyltransferase [Spirochaetia bacterium]|nr:glycosyltransferase [Spirochaetia bacterium]